MEISRACYHVTQQMCAKILLCARIYSSFLTDKHLICEYRTESLWSKDDTEDRALKNLYRSVSWQAWLFRPWPLNLVSGSVSDRHSKLSELTWKASLKTRRAKASGIAVQLPSEACWTSGGPSTYSITSNTSGLLSSSVGENRKSIIDTNPTMREIHN